MRIDSHVCLSASHPPEHLQAILARNRFDAAILLVKGGPLPEVPPHIAGIVVRDPELASFDEYQRHPLFRGVCSSLADAAPLAEELARRGIPLDVDMRPDDFPALLELADRLPTLRMVIDHMARPNFQQGITAEWERGMEAAAALPQVYCKISGLLTEVESLPWSSAPIRPFVQHALRVFGPARLMFGSEWPVRLPEVIWKESLAAFTQSIGAHSQEVREQLLGGTAQQFYAVPG